MFRRNDFQQWGPLGDKTCGVACTARDAVEEWRQAAETAGAAALAKSEAGVWRRFVDAHAENVAAFGYWSGAHPYDLGSSAGATHRAFGYCLRSLVDANDLIYLGRTAQGHIHTSAIGLGADIEDTSVRQFETVFKRIEAIVAADGQANRNQMYSWVGEALGGQMTNKEYEVLLETHFTVTDINWNRWR